MVRAPCCDKVGLKRGRWTAEEDELLSKYITTNGEGSWRSLPKNAGLLRCGKSCRLRWINYLRADLKRGNISKEEEETIAKLHAAVGSRWSQIASHLPGRTDNEIKNYWNSHLSRRIHTIRRIGGDGSQVVVDIGLPIGKRRGGRTSRSAMKKSFANSSFWRERRRSATTGVLPTSSSVQSSQDSSMMAPQEDDSLNMHGPDGDLLKQIETDLLSPTQFIDSELWATNDDMEGWIFGPSEGSSVGWVSNEQALLLNGDMHDGSTLAMKEGVVVGLREEGTSDHTLDNRQNCDMEMEEMASRLWGEEGLQVMPWLWESGDYGELEMGGMEDSGSQEESFESWVLSDVM